MAVPMTPRQHGLLLIVPALVQWPALVAAKCSPAEQACGELCCCVTCTCLEGPHRCEDMWGHATDPVGRADDERFASKEWSDNMMREHQERHAAWIEEHRAKHEQHMQERAERKRKRLEEKAKEKGVDVSEIDEREYYDDAMQKMREQMAELHERHRKEFRDVKGARHRRGDRDRDVDWADAEDTADGAMEEDDWETRAGLRKRRFRKKRGHGREEDDEDAQAHQEL